MIIENHWDCGTGTTIHNISGRAIYEICTTMGTKILSGIYLTILKIIHSGHQMKWINISYEYMLGSSDPSTRRPAVQNLHMNHPKIQNKYNSILKRVYKSHGVS